MRKDKQTCFMCDRTSVQLTDRGWCYYCEDEFSKMQNNRQTICSGCKTPATCIMKHDCAIDPKPVNLQQLILL